MDIGGTIMPTKEQQRSAFALLRINDFGAQGVPEKDANFIVGTPNMILTNGISQTMAFLLSKGEERSTRVFCILKDWLSQEIKALPNSANNHQFLSQFAKLEQNDYLRAQQEALALLQWLKRYARAFGV
jgi:CRISPR-associated protein Cmr5